MNITVRQVRVNFEDIHINVNTDNGFIDYKGSLNFDSHAYLAKNKIDILVEVAVGKAKNGELLQVLKDGSKLDARVSTQHNL